MSINDGIMSSKTSEWSTPQALFDQLDAEFHFDLDPCGTEDNAKCPFHFTKADDGLSKDWSGYVVFMNPPYGREIGSWMRKAYEASQNGSIVVCLIPARTNTAWWHSWAARGEIRFLRGRVRFGGHKCGAPFPSAIVIFRPTGGPA